MDQLRLVYIAGCWPSSSSTATDRLDGAHWIFYCHTREELRNQGNGKLLLAQIVRTIVSRDDAAWILRDTIPDDLASRNAALQPGFIPAGVFTSYRLLLGVLLSGHWDGRQEHIPHLEQSIEAAQRRAAR